MSTSIKQFENKYMQMMRDIAQITKDKKQLEEQEKKVKEELEKAMDEHNIKSIDNQFIKITRVAASSSTSVNLKALENEEPDLYKELIEDYPKVTSRKAYIKFTVK